MPRRLAYSLLLAIALIGLSGCGGTGSAAGASAAAKAQVVGHCHIFCSEVRIAANARGDQVASWVDVAGSSKSAVDNAALYAAFRRHGQPWSPAVKVSDDFSSRGVGPAPAGFLRIDGAGNAYLLNVPVSRPFGYPPVVWVRDYRSGRWLRTMPTRTHLGVLGLSLAPLPSGAGALAAWTRSTPALRGPFYIRLARWDESTRSWQRLAPPPNPNIGALWVTVATDISGDVALAWRDTSFDAKVKPKLPSQIRIAVHELGHPWREAAVTKVWPADKNALPLGFCLGPSCQLAVSHGRATLIYTSGDYSLTRKDRLHIVSVKDGSVVSRSAALAPTAFVAGSGRYVLVGMPSRLLGAAQLTAASLWSPLPPSVRKALAGVLAPGQPLLVWRFPADRSGPGAYLLARAGRLEPLPVLAPNPGDQILMSQADPSDGAPDQGAEALAAGQALLAVPTTAHGGGEDVTVLDVGR